MRCFFLTLFVILFSYKNPVVRRKPMRLLKFMVIILLLAGCGGGGGGNTGTVPATNTGGGYTLMASGGTVNDGSGVAGLSVLASLRDSQGWGPVQSWTITITGPGVSGNTALVMEYTDPRIGSYMSWEWSGIDPQPGTYTATATNGAVTIHYDFSVLASVIHRPAVNAGSSGGDISLSWPSVSGAASYSYVACSPAYDCISGMTTTTSTIISFGTLTAGDYLIEVKAYATNRIALGSDHSSSPGLAAHENVSEYTFSLPVGGDQISDHYSFSVAGGVLDFGMSGPSGPINGLAIWTSVQDTTSPGNPAAPAGDWNITVTDPHGLVLNYLYPSGERHDAYWLYGVEPVSGGTYTVSASYGAAIKTAVFSLANTTPALDPLLYSQINGSLVTNGTNTNLKDINITWPAVTGAHSYYVSLWAEVWNTSSKQYDYREVWGQWVNTASARVVNGTVATGLWCDVFVTAHEIDMTSAAPPAVMPTRADMSENYYGYSLSFSTP